MKRLLLIGPRQVEGDVGGVVVLFEALLAQLKQRGVDFCVINSNKRAYESRLVATIHIFWRLLRESPSVSHVSFHGTAADFKYLALPVVLICRLLGRGVSLRKFAGSFIEIYQSSGVIQRLVILLALRLSSFCLFETKYLVDYFKRFNGNTYWFPNSREPTEYRASGSFEGRFVFVGHVRREKGIVELIDAAECLPDSYSIDVYGFVDEGLEKQLARSRLNYCGVIPPSDAQKIISSYNVLVLPSYREGYPGVVIEAFSVGVPVVATRLSGITEMVTDGKDGLLVDPGDSAQLREAMMHFSKTNYRGFSNAAQEKFMDFDSRAVTSRFLDLVDIKGEGGRFAA